MKTENRLNEKLISVEIWSDFLGWQDYDCPKNAGTVKDYADWCIGEHSDFWATVNIATDKIRLNGWYVIDGADHFKD